MNRLDRITAILIQLQSKRVVKAQEIADRFNISLRTVYRDVKSLDDAGIPIIGEAGIGYSLMEGYRLPPVMFTRDEASAMLTAEKLVEKLTDHSTREAYQSAMFKIKAVLRLSEKDHIENMEQHIKVIPSPYHAEPDNQTAHLQPLLTAIVEKAMVSINYFAEQNQEETQRQIEPVGIFYMGRYWYLVAFCRMRKDYRTFRTERIRKLTVTGEHFETAHPALQSFLDKMSRERELHKIVIRVEKDIIKYFGEQKYYNGYVSQEEKDGLINMHFLTGSPGGFAKWFMLFGDHAEILEPASLKTLVKEQAEGILKKLQMDNQG